MRVTFESRRPENEAATIITYFFRPEQPVEYTPGQFIEWTLPHDNPDDRGTTRWFTLSSSPTDELLSITTKFAPESSSFKKAMRALQPGTQLDMIEASGDFVLPKDASRPLVFVAGGMGLTPFHSIVSWLNATHEHRDITFLYAVRNEAEIIFQDTFKAAGIEPTIVVSEPSESWTGKTGRLSATAILSLAKPADNALIYVSGPEPMTEALEADLKNAGVPESQLVLDFFPGYENTYTDNPAQ